MDKATSNSVDLFLELVRPFQSASETLDNHEKVGGRVIRCEFSLEGFWGVAEIECDDGFWAQLVNRGSGWIYTSRCQMERSGQVQPTAVASAPALRKLIEADLHYAPALGGNSAQSADSPRLAEPVRLSAAVKVEMGR